MLKINLFKKKDNESIEQEIKKFPRRKRKRLNELWVEWENGRVLKIEERKK